MTKKTQKKDQKDPKTNPFPFTVKQLRSIFGGKKTLKILVVLGQNHTHAKNENIFAPNLPINDDDDDQDRGSGSGSRLRNEDIDCFTVACISHNAAEGNPLK